jgi:hypothetical protein
MESMPDGYDCWSCPFCGTVATGETKEHVLCESRTCSCGAIALAAPACDQDEIIDDALGIFGVQIREETKGFDALLLSDLRDAGVEMREGQSARVSEGFWGEYTSLWFRRSNGSAPK